MNPETKQFLLYCTLGGQVTEVFRDDEHILPESIIGNLFFSIVVPGDLEKALNFFLELKTNGTAIGWEINLPTPTGAETFSFFGGLLDDRIGIAAATTQNGAQALFADFTRMNNEQVNMIRTIAKQNKELQALGGEPAVNYYEELSRLNNDLVNMQRELFKKNKELDELNKLKNEFLGIAAHDLRSPLSVIIGYSQYVLEETKGILSDDHQYMIDAILTSSKFMLQLLNDLLDVSAIESGKLNLNLDKINLVNIVKRNVELNNVISQKKNISICLNTHPSIPDIVCDGGKIEQVLNNLIGNAVKFSMPGTAIRVGIRKAEAEVVVSVADQGPGIPDAELGKLFKPFVTTSVQSTAGEKSTGLGLSIVRNLVLGHKGKIWVESKLGEGSTFYFSLPANS